MAKKRDRLEIIYTILKVISDKHNSIRPTPLMRYSNMSSQRFNEYFAELVEKDFVKEVLDRKGRKYITLTDKGFRFLEKYQMILSFVDEFEL